MANTKWREFKFKAPNTPFQVNFNFLIDKVGAEYAFKYATEQNGKEVRPFKQELEAFMRDNANPLINEFVTSTPYPGNSITEHFGFLPGWSAPVWRIGADGQKFYKDTQRIKKGQVEDFKLPMIDPLYVPWSWGK